jgi:hypothetical protein
LLPSDNLHTYPVFYTNVELGYLQGSEYLISQIVNKKSQEVKNYHQLCKLSEKVKKQIAFDDFLMGKTWASERSFDLKYSDGSLQKVLVPFLEFLCINHE